MLGADAAGDRQKLRSHEKETCPENATQGRRGTARDDVRQTPAIRPSWPLFQSLEPESSGKVVAQINRDWYLVESDSNRRLVSFVKMGGWQFFEQTP